MFLLRGFRHPAALIHSVELICQPTEHKLRLIALIIIHNYAAEMVGKLAKNTPIHNNVQAPAPERPTAMVNISAPEVCAPEVGSPEVCAPELSAPELSAQEVSGPEVSGPEVSALEVGSPEVYSAPSICVIQPLFVIFQDFIEFILRHGYSSLSSLSRIA